MFFEAVRLEHAALGLPQWPLWHASVAYRSPLTGRPVARLLWTSETVARAHSVALEALAGVGDQAAAQWEIGQIAEHVRIPMTPTEAVGLRDLIMARCPTRRSA